MAVSTSRDRHRLQRGIRRMNPTSVAKVRRSLPGDAAWWIFVTAEFFTLCMFFVGCAFAWRDDPSGFAVARTALDPAVASVNAGILITSGFAAAIAVHSARTDGGLRAAAWLLMAAAALGCVFLAVKSFEYHEKLSAGIHLSTHAFWFFWFFLTGFHFLHVVVGVGFLTAMAVAAWRLNRVAVGADVASESRLVETRTGIESAAVFWHMLDLVWVILLPLLYLR
jgi:nitric oxide reductase NorE protein